MPRVVFVCFISQTILIIIIVAVVVVAALFVCVASGRFVCFVYQIIINNIHNNNDLVTIVVVATLFVCVARGEVFFFVLFPRGTTLLLRG